MIFIWIQLAMRFRCSPPRTLSISARQIRQISSYSTAVESLTRYWQKIPRWRDVKTDEFLNYPWQVRVAAAYKKIQTHEVALYLIDK